MNTKLKRVAHAALDSAEAPVPWDVIDQAIAQSKRFFGRKKGAEGCHGDEDSHKLPEKTTCSAAQSSFSFIF